MNEEKYVIKVEDVNHEKYVSEEFAGAISLRKALLPAICKRSPSAISKAVQGVPSESTGDRVYKVSYEQARDIISKKIPKVDIKYKVQAFFNFKGGTGKTSICHQLSFHFALFGFKVLVLDLDSQAHLSSTLGFDESADYCTLYDVIFNNMSIHTAIHKTAYEGLDIIPASLALTRLEVPLSSMPAREKVLGRLLKPLREEYDFIFIDTNPTITTLNYNVLLAADRLNIVCETQPYSVKGLDILVEEIHRYEEVMDAEINYKIIANKYESKTVSAQESLGGLRHNYGEKMYNSLVRKVEDINISARDRLPVLAFCTHKSAAFEDLNDLAWEIFKEATVEIKSKKRRG